MLKAYFGSILGDTKRKRLLWRLFIYGATALALLAGFFVLYFAFGLLFPGSQNQALAAAVLLILIFSLLLGPLFKFTQAQYERRFSQPITPRKVFPLETALVKIGQSASLETLALELVGSLRHNLQSSFAAFALYSEIDKLVRFDFVKFEGENSYEPLFRRLSDPCVFGFRILHNPALYDAECTGRAALARLGG